MLQRAFALRCLIGLTSQVGAKRWAAQGGLANSQAHDCGAAAHPRSSMLCNTTPLLGSRSQNIQFICARRGPKQLAAVSVVELSSREAFFPHTDTITVGSDKTFEWQMPASLPDCTSPSLQAGEGSSVSEQEHTCIGKVVKRIKSLFKQQCLHKKLHLATLHLRRMFKLICDGNTLIS